MSSIEEIERLKLVPKDYIEKLISNVALSHYGENDMATDTLHNKILEKYINKFKKDGYKVVRIDNSYRPDAIIIDYNKKRTIAFEVETSLDTIYRYFRKTKGKKKYPRLGFDHTIISFPKLPGGRRKVLTQERLEMARSLRKEGLSYRQIGEKIGICMTTAMRWLKGKYGKWFIGYRKKLKENNITVINFNGEVFE